MSLIYNENNNGPRTLPCGTPVETGSQSDWLSFDIVHCCLPWRYEFIHWSVEGEKLINLSLLNRMSMSTESKALLKSSNVRTVSCLVSILFFMSSVTLIKAVHVLWCERKPDWQLSRILFSFKKSEIWEWTMNSRAFERAGKMLIGRYSFGAVGFTFLGSERNR